MCGECRSEFSLSSILSAIEKEGDGVKGKQRSKKRKAQDGSSNGSSSSSSKRSKPPKDEPASPEMSPPLSPPGRLAEKRLSRYRSTPSKALLERMEMAKEHRMFLLFRSPLPRVQPRPSSSSASAEQEPIVTEYYVVGPTGTVYSIKLTNLPTCNCPDNTKVLLPSISLSRTLL